MSVTHRVPHVVRLFGGSLLIVAVAACADPAPVAEP